jgi:hypothetical protein
MIPEGLLPRIIESRDLSTRLSSCIRYLGYDHGFFFTQEKEQEHTSQYSKHEERAHDDKESLVHGKLQYE